VSPASEIVLVAGRELRKSTRSIKGIILAILTVLVSVVAAFICILVESRARTKLGVSSTAAFRQAIEAAQVKGGTDPAVAHYVATMPLSLILFLKVLVWVGPILVMVLGFDGVSGDVQHRTIRYWTVRTRRWSYLLGKFFGLWATVSTITLALTLLTSLAVLAFGYMTVTDFFTWGLRAWLITALILGAWTSLATFISSRFKTPLFALLSIVGSFFFLWLLEVVGFLLTVNEAFEQKQAGSAAAMSPIHPRWFTYLYPNNYDDLLLSPKLAHIAGGLGACAAFMLVFVGLATFLFAKKDV
jgi:ABC-type transport system involved in multi-copper enzyme maturation permease subunit